MAQEVSQSSVPVIKADVARLRQRRLSFSAGLEHATQHIILVVPRGEVDLCTAPRLRETLTRAIDEGGRVIVIDLSEVTFIDASGLAVIVWAARDLCPDAVALVLPHRSLARIFRICGLECLLRIYGTPVQAVVSLQWQATSRTAAQSSPGTGELALIKRPDCRR